MSQIGDLVKELAPMGVQFKTLGDVGEIFRGKRFTKADYVDEGGVGCIHYGEIYTDYGTTAAKTVARVRPDLAPSLRFARKGDVVLTDVGETVEDVGKAVAWLGDEDVAIHDHCYVIRSSVDPAYLSYYMQTAAFRSDKDRYVARTKVKTLLLDGLKRIVIPVPPVEVQREIVRVLDLFSGLEADLATQLDAELKARRVQHAHYRNKALSFPEDGAVRWATLGEISAKVSSGATPLAGRTDYYEGGDIPWLRTQEVFWRDIWDTQVKITDKALRETAVKWIPANCVIVAISGATAARAAVNKIPLTTNQHCCNLEINPAEANYRYVFHWVTANYEKLKSLGQGARSDLNSGLIKSFPIAVPPLQEQEHLAGLLDKFEILVNDLSSALPAELNARRKQYEHYREHLLTFKELAT